MNRLRHLAGLFVLSACSGSPQSEQGSEVALGLAGECSAAPLASRSLAGACSAAAQGTVAVQGALPTGAAPGSLLMPRQAYGLHLVESDTPGEYVGRFRYNVGGGSLGQRQAIFVGSPSVPVSLQSSQQAAPSEALECRRYLSDATKNGLVGDSCGELKAGFLSSPLTDNTYTIDIGPTASRWVRFYIAPEERTVSQSPTSGFCGAPPPAICAAGATPVPVTAAGHASLAPPSILADTVYGVRLNQTWDARPEGALVFVPASTGTYALNLGTPYFPVQVREESKRELIASSCTALVATDADCSPFKSTRLLQLTAGTRYRVELNGIGDNSWVRLAISAVAPPAETLPPRAGLGLWLRSDLGVEATGQQVSAWRDQSDAHRDALPAQLDGQPQLVASGFGGVPTVRFDGNDMLAFPEVQTSDFTVFWVAKSNWTDAGEYDSQFLLGDSIASTNSYLGYRWTNLFDNWEGSAYVGDVLVPRLFTITNLNNVMSVEQGGGNGTFSFEGAAIFSQIGREQGYVAQSFRGDLSEILIYERALSPAERLAVNSYLSNRYALTPP